MIDVLEIKQAIENADVAKLKHLLSVHDLKIVDGKIVASTAQIKDAQSYWDKRQLVKKIGLNSLYGALLNQHMRFFDKRIGQSVTLCGRQIVKHMSAQVNEILTEKYDHTGVTVIYNDTDSCYFSAYPVLKQQIDSGELEWNKELCVSFYDAIGEQVNDSFPQFMERAFHAPLKNGAIIKAGRELVGDRALFIKKKKYAINIYDKEGTRKDVDAKRGSIKAMGLDTKRSDTPTYVQLFLQEILDCVLAGKTRENIIKMIVDFKTTLSNKPSWEKGSPRAVNKITWYSEQEAKSHNGKFNMPGHVRAAINWNFLRRMNGDNYSMKIVDGMKVVVCKLKPNALNLTSVAYPTDELRLPEWFKQLSFDDEAMETVLVDKKLENLIGILKWDLKQDTNIKSSFNDLFAFE